MESRFGQESALATWAELSRDSLRAAKLLARGGYYRSSVSRSYYAAYCATAGELTSRRVSFPHGWGNPAHEQPPGLVAHNLPLSRGTRHRFARNLRLLRRAREDADYRPGTSVNQALVLECLRLAGWVLETLEIDDD